MPSRRDVLSSVLVSCAAAALPAPARAARVAAGRVRVDRRDRAQRVFADAHREQAPSAQDHEVGRGAGCTRAAADCQRSIAATTS